VLSLPPSCRMWLALQPCDMRKGFGSLLAEARFRWPSENPLGGDLFIFLGRQRTTVKVIWWSSGGLSLYSKRLEKGCFRLPVQKPGEPTVRLAAADLAMLLEGIDWTRVRRPKLYEPPRSLTNLSPQKIDKTPNF
jgi:transposase